MIAGRLLLMLLLCVSIFGFQCAPAATAKAPDRPRNIVYIVADDQGWKDVGYHGSDIKTPNIDALARGGIRLENFHAQPLCTQTRAALMTGRYPFRTGMQSVVIPSAGSYGLDVDEWLLPQALKGAGYETVMIGKWHLGHADKKFWPRQRGFDYHYGPVLGEIDYFTRSAHGKLDWFRNNEPVKEEGYATELLGQDAVRMIKGHDAKSPLFLYLAFTAPHSPFQAPQKYLDRNVRIAEPTRRAYAAMITALDDQVGQVVAALKERRMLDDTLIVYQSDNGGVRSSKFAGEGDVSKLVLPADNGPYRDGKGTLYEGGTRVIAFANWKGHIKAGTSSDQPIHEVDMFPTLVTLAGGSLTGHKPLDGLDVWPTISENRPSPRETTIYSIEPQQAAVLKGDWKLVWQVSLPSRVELFNLTKDPYEKDNLADTNPQKVSELKELIEAEAKTAAPSKFIQSAFGAMMPILFGSTNLPPDPDEDEQLDEIP